MNVEPATRAWCVMRHTVCGKSTKLNPHVAEVRARAPDLFGLFPCKHCGGTWPRSQFVWEFYGTRPEEPV